MRGISLFTGIGAEALAASWAGIEHVAFCEMDPWCQSKLRTHWPDVPIITDAKDVTYESIRAIADTKGIRCGTRWAESERRLDDTLAFGVAADAKGRQDNERISRIMGEASPRGRSSDTAVSVGRPIIDILTGGPPCQPASIAGRRQGAGDDRWLWPETIRILRELKPTWAVLENPPGIASLVQSGEGTDLETEGFGIDANILCGIRDEIEETGYETGIICIPACGVEAPHLRYRYFILAHTRGGQRRERRRAGPGGEESPGASGELEGCGIAATHASSARQQGCDTTMLAEAKSKRFAGLYGPSIPDWAGGQWNAPWPLTEPKRRNGRTVERRFCNLDDGTPGRLVRPSITTAERRRRIGALGNCNPPQMYYTIFRAIMEAENAA